MTDKYALYTIRQQSGKLLGPFPLERVKGLIRAGMVQMTDLLAKVGDPYRPIYTYPELSTLFPQSHRGELLEQNTEENIEIEAEQLLEGLEPVKVLSPEEKREHEKREHHQLRQNRIKARNSPSETHYPSGLFQLQDSPYPIEDFIDADDPLSTPSAVNPSVPDESALHPPKRHPPHPKRAGSEQPPPSYGSPRPFSPQFKKNKPEPSPPPKPKHAPHWPPRRPKTTPPPPPRKQRQLENSFRYSLTEDPTAPELKTASAPYAGNISEVPFPRLYYNIYINEYTGRLMLIDNSQLSREIFFVRGTPWIIRFPGESDDLPQRLVAKRLCTFEQLKIAMNRVAEFGGELVDHLVALSFIEPGVLYEVLKEQFIERLMSLFEWQKGRYLFFINERPQSSAFPITIDNLQTIKEGIYTRVDPLYIKMELEPHYNHPIKIAVHPKIQLEELRLSGKETRIFNQINKVSNLWQLISQIEFARVATREEIHRFIFFLGIIEMIRVNNQTLWRSLIDSMRLLQSSSDHHSAEE